MPNTKRNRILSQRSGLFWLWISILVVIADQVAKYLVVRLIDYNQVIHVLPFLNFILRYNTGAAFSFLGREGGWQIYAISAVVVIVLIVLLFWLKKLPATSKWMGVSLSLIVGGALGNLIDRIRLSYVIDFIDFHIGHWHFATFNIADSAVSIGAVMLILHVLFTTHKNR